MGEGHGAHRRGEMRGMGGILLGKAYLGSMEGVHPARMAQPCGYVGEEEKNGTRRPGYGESLRVCFADLAIELTEVVDPADGKETTC